jgi:hypothetical protein
VYGQADQIPPGWGRIWLYGEPRSGKTLAASTFPQPFFLVMQNEDSIKALRGLPFRFGEIQPQNGDVRSSLITLVEQLIARGQRSLDDLYANVGRTLVIDAFTHLQDLIIAEIADMMINQGSKKGKMDEPKWGLLRSYMLNLRDQLWRLPMHVIITSLGKTKDGQGGPLGQGTGSGLLASSCDALGYCDTEPNGSRIIHFSKYGQNPAGTRFGVQGMHQGPISNMQLWSALSPFLGYR